MARSSNYPIENMNTDWGLDPITGLPFSGQSVQSFIKRSFNEKVGAGLFDAGEMVLYLFKNEEDKELFDYDRTLKNYIGTIPMQFGTTQKRIKVTPDSSSNTINATMNQEVIDLGMSIIEEERELGEVAWRATGADIGVRVYIDANNVGTYTEIPGLSQVVLSSSGRVSVNIRPYLPTGTSRVRFYFYDIEDETISQAFLYNITIAEMYIEAWEGDFRWNNALVEDESSSPERYSLGGFRIVGNIPKTIHIDIMTATDLVASYAVDIGTKEETEKAFFFTKDYGLDLTTPTNRNGESLPALTTGIYNVKVWLTSGQLSTEDTAVIYNIMYVAAGDQYQAKLVVMNNSGHIVNNYDESAHLCDYAIYNAGQTYGNVIIEITPYIDSTQHSKTTLPPTQVRCEEQQTLNHSINLVTNSNQLTIKYKVTLVDGNSQEGSSGVDNKEVFQAETGVTFYINPSLRDNGESGKEVVYNVASNNTVALDGVEWQNMSWVNGVDGWTFDDTPPPNARKCLMIPARSRLMIPASAYRFLSGDPATYEFCFKVKNVSDYNENIITIAQNPEREDFMGIRIRPTNVTIHSDTDKTDGNDSYQGTNFVDEEVVHLLISIQRSFSGRTGMNLVSGYLNGVKAFEFDYGSSGWSNATAPLILGSDSADLYLYMFRVYGSTGLSSSGAENNWLNTLASRDDKVDYRHFIDSILRSPRAIDYESVKNDGRYNFFVIEMTSGAGVPTKAYPNGGRANVEMHYGLDKNGNSRSDWDWKIYDVETKGQGTTSMNYYLWNIRWRIDKTDESGERMVSYFDTPSTAGNIKTFNERVAHSSPTVWFDGENNHPAVKRITAKINFASSMQSHKMGATRAYSILHDQIEEGALLNEAQRQARSNSLPAPSVAVYQYPAFGFQKVDINGVVSYTFIGLFTIGPDKGDNPTFGYDLVSNDLVSLEGVDHAPQMAKFSVPWDDQVAYVLNANEDAFLAVKDMGNNFTNAFEVGNAKTAKTKKPEQAGPVVTEEFRDAYSVVYDNSTLIAPIALDDPEYGGNDAAAVLQNINNNISDFRSRSIDDRITFTDAQFWIEGDYKLYHYEAESDSFVSGYKRNGEYNSPLDLRTDTSISDGMLANLSLGEQNELFKQARRQRFLAEAPDYWDMKELAFNYVFLLIFGATDNFAKNQYPYKMGGKWRFRQDDLDTIFDIDNMGGQTKPADIEFEDSLDGYPYFAGSNSVLWNLVHESMWQDYNVGNETYPGLKTMGRDMINLMSDIAGGAHTFDGFIKFFEECFWSRAQEYFPPSAYNIDANIKYEEAWLASGQDADPLRQSLGSHYLAEKLWIRRRALYCMSLFGAGGFSINTETNLGSIKFRPNQLGKMTVTTAESMYPGLIFGAGDIRPTERTLAGEECEFDNLNTDGTTTYTLQAVDYLTSLGDLSKLKLGNEDGGKFSVSGKKLRSLKLGDADPENVDSNVRILEFDSNGLPCLEVLDIRNNETLSSEINLSNCKRIRDVFAEGTGVASIILPRGSKIERLHLPENVTKLSYQVIKSLYDLDLPEDPKNIQLIYLEECDALNGMETLSTIFYNETGQNLQFIRLLWNGEMEATGAQVRMLSLISQNKDKDGDPQIYNGVNTVSESGNSSNPVLEGRLLANAYYQSDIDILANGNSPTESETHTGLQQILASYFGPLYISYSTDNRYIDFADPDIVGVLYAGNVGDGVGVTIAQASEVTSLGNGFRANSDISSFNELPYFTSITSLPAGSNNSSGTFSGCTNLSSITIPGNITTIGAYSFYNCTSLSELTLLHDGSSTLSVGASAFTNAPITRVNIDSIYAWMRTSWASDGTINTNHSLYINNNEVTSLVLPSNLTSVPARGFYRCNHITSLSIPDGYTSIGASAFYNCTALTGDLVLPSSITSIGSEAFIGCNALNSLTIPSSIRNVYLTTIGGNMVTNGTIIVGGNLRHEGNTGSTIRAKNIVIEGNLVSTRDSAVFSGSVVSVRVYGDCTLTANTGLVYAGSGGSSSMLFFEVNGKVTGSGRFFFNPTSATSMAQDCVIHLGYDGTDEVAALPSHIFKDSVGNINPGRIDKVYVGSGESVEADTAVLNVYLNDSNWSAYTSKLDIWSNYTGDYKNNG